MVVVQLVEQLLRGSNLVINRLDLLSTALSTILIQLTGQSSDADFGVLGELKAHNYFATVLRSHFFLGIPDALC